LSFFIAFNNSLVDGNCFDHGGCLVAISITKHPTPHISEGFPFLSVGFKTISGAIQ